MPMTTEEIDLKPQEVRSFAGVRGRVRAAVEAQPRSVTLLEALAQARRFETPVATSKSTEGKSSKPDGCGSGSSAVPIPNGAI
jgi:hypothetical protein